MSVKDEVLKAELKEFGKWARAHGLYGSAKNILDVEEVEATEFLISDERAMDIDRTISLLKRRDPEAAKILSSHYINNMSLRDVAKVYRINKDKVAKILAMGVACIGMGLEMKAANDEKY